MWKSFRPKLGHDRREIHSTVLREKHLTHTPRDPELKHKLNFDAQVFINNDVEPIRAKSLFPRGFVEIKPWFRLAPSPQLEILDAAIDAFDEGTRSQMTDTQASTLASQA